MSPQGSLVDPVGRFNGHPSSLLVRLKVLRKICGTVEMGMFPCKAFQMVEFCNRTTWADAGR